MDDPTAPDDWQLSTFAPFPDAAQCAKYVSRPLAVSLVANHHSAWQSVPKGPNALGCRHAHNSGRIGTSEKHWCPYCDGWDCEWCAIQKVIPHLFHAYNLIHDRSLIFVKDEPATAMKNDTYRRAVSRGTDFDFPGSRPWAIRVDRDGRKFGYSTCQPAGSIGQRGEWFDAIDAFEHLRTVGLALPGPTRVPSYVGIDGPPKPPPSGIVPHSAGLSDAQQEAFLILRDDLAEQDHGTSFATLLHASPLDADDVARRAAATARQGSSS